MFDSVMTLLSSFLGQRSYKNFKHMESPFYLGLVSTLRVPIYCASTQSQIGEMLCVGECANHYTIEPSVF